jgi:hypothetical protein
MRDSRLLVGATLVGLTAMVPSACVTETPDEKGPSDRPNILWIIAED